MAWLSAFCVPRTEEPEPAEEAPHEEPAAVDPPEVAVAALSLIPCDMQLIDLDVVVYKLKTSRARLGVA